MFQNLPTMPFDLWFEMKKAAQAEEDESVEVDLRRHYQSVGQHRRDRLASGGKKHALKRAEASSTSSRHARRSRRFGMHDEYSNDRNESGSPIIDDSAD